MLLLISLEMLQISVLNIDTENPDNVIKLHLYKQFVNVFLCLNIVSLHKRNYRQFQGQASLKKSLAAAILIKARWLEELKKTATDIDRSNMWFWDYSY